MKKQFILMASAFLLAASAVAQSVNPAATAQTTAFPLYDEPYRPQYHFSPAMHFMNDPNGLVYFKGIWHLYYQYNPLELVAGHQAWGHATSTDLIHWKNLPIAIPEMTTGPVTGQIFTGSAVVDENNTSGFFKGVPGGGLVAIYTLNEPTKEVQNVAYSLDDGTSYIEYKGNPVLDLQNPNFRDPKVFWYAPEHRWIMAVALPRAHQVLFYGSPNLKNWIFLSAFGPAGIEGFQYECPNLFQVPVQGTNDKKWVLVVAINPGAPLGGSINEYFVGNFDGTTFKSDDGVARLMDFGKDFYAVQTYNNTPNGDAIAVGWMSNWQYTQEVPTFPWRGVFTVPRFLSLRQNPTQTGDLLAQTPIALDSLHDKTLFNGPATVNPGNPLTISSQGNSSFEFHTTLIGGNKGRLNIDIRNAAGEQVTVGVDWDHDGQVYVERGQTSGFSNRYFTNDFSTWDSNPDNSVELHVLVDRSVLEVFVDGGIKVCTSSFFMSKGPPTEMQWEAVNSPVSVEDLEAYSLKSIWP
jgi:sucrose-6-phosphate hydrolase SacC (GH32 family)